MRRLLPLLFWLFTTSAIASHIVGGEFEMKYISPGLYRINLIIYFDMLNGNPGAKDLLINARIFRMSDNAVMMNIGLPLTTEENVGYTQPECSAGEIVTKKLVYTAVVTMTAQQFSHPAGYYIAWERCCRNYTITNIQSNDPTSGGMYAGQTFYLEFPPITKNDQYFINSSPRLFPPLNDYACINRPYYVDFAGVDDDGDSLVYSLVNPLNTKSADALPPGDGLPRPKPYPDVVWRTPFGITNIIGGSPDLRISKEGFLTVTPRKLGLFVFAVKCVEFRDGVKIGEVRRDFQMLVVDCQEAVAPVVQAQQSDGTFSSVHTSVTYSNTVSDEQRCIKIRVSDQDAFRVTPQGQKESVEIRAIPIGFKSEEVGAVLPDVSSAILTPDNPYVDFEICFDKCPLKPGPFQIGIVSYDDACALPLTDTVKITVNIQPPANSPVQMTADIADDIEEGQTETWQIVATDADNDPITLDIFHDGFELAEKGLSIEEVAFQPGRYEAKLKWDALCDVYDFREQQDYKIKFVVDDLDVCLTNPEDSTVVNLHVILPYSNPPVIGSTLSAQQIHDGIERNIFDNLNFKVFGTDSDPQTLTLEMQPQGFDAEDYGVAFAEANAQYYVESPFGWTLDCGKIDLEDKDDFSFLFIVRDQIDKCGIYRADSLTVNVHANPALNNKPKLTVANLSADIGFESGRWQMTMGQDLQLRLRATDTEIDAIRIELIDADGDVEPKGYQFSDAEGVGTVEAPFNWAPDCSIFKNRDYENDYVFRFRAIDNRCFNVKADTIEVMLNIKDIDANAMEFIPPNFITPNNDGCNDFFGLEEVEGTYCGDLHIPNLPPDNCVGKFKMIRIYNRWGRQVFESPQRNFRWYPDGEAGGVYFYTVFYSDREYKGSVTVMY